MYPAVKLFLELF